MIRFRAFQQSDSDAVRALSREQYGEDSYQADVRYFDWLYRANPSARGSQDCLVADQDGKIVGAIHRMVLAGHGGSSDKVVLSLQNHFMAPDARSGAGLLLLKRATRDGDVAFSPGVQGRLAESYRRLDYTEIPGFWFTRPLNAARVVRDLVGSRFKTRSSFSVRMARLSARYPDLVLTPDPSAELLDALVAVMVEATSVSDATRVAWTQDLVRWRYFSQGGPRHLLVYCPRSGDIAVLAFGVRKGVRVVRVMEMHMRNGTGFIDDVLRVGRSAGAGLALAFTTRPDLARAYEARGFRLRDNATSTFVSNDAPVSFDAAATDVGFEAFGTEMLA